MIIYQHDNMFFNFFRISVAWISFVNRGLKSTTRKKAIVSLLYINHLLKCFLLLFLLFTLHLVVVSFCACRNFT